MHVIDNSTFVKMVDLKCKLISSNVAVSDGIKDCTIARYCINLLSMTFETLSSTLLIEDDKNSKIDYPGVTELYLVSLKMGKEIRKGVLIRNVSTLEDKIFDMYNEYTNTKWTLSNISTYVVSEWICTFINGYLPIDKYPWKTKEEQEILSKWFIEYMKRLEITTKTTFSDIQVVVALEMFASSICTLMFMESYTPQDSDVINKIKKMYK